MESIRALLEQQPLLALFLTIALGYLVGELSWRGFSLGVGAVLFVALGMGWLFPQAAPAPLLGSFGLALFLYAVGIHYGGEFFRGLTSPSGLRANLIALVGVLCAGGASLLLAWWAGLSVGHGLGLFSGSGTSTPTLQAALAAVGNDDPAVGYSVAYPFGVAGPILFLYLAFRWWQPQLEPAQSSSLALLEIALQRPELIGRTLGELSNSLPLEVQIVALRRGAQNQPGSPQHVIAAGDVVLAVASDRNSLESARERLGAAVPGVLTADRRDLDYLRVFASRPAVVGRPVGQLQLPGERAAAIVNLRRGDTELQARPDIILEFGDRVGLLAHRNDFAALRKFFGDSIKGTAEFSYVSIGLGLAIGIGVGVIPIGLPGVGSISLGLAGVLIVGLILGKIRRTGGLNWTLPVSANLVLRNLGLTVFLAQVGMASGPKFAASLAQNGLQMLGLGVLVVVALVVPIFLIGLHFCRLPFDEVAGIVTGASGNPALLAYASKLTGSERPDLGYATIYPGMTIVKILFASIVAALS